MAATSRLRDLGAFGLLFFKVVLFFNVAGQGRGGPSPASRQRVLPSPTPAAKGNGKFSQSGLKKKKMQKKTPKKPNPEPVQLSTRPHGAAPPPPGGVTCSRPAGRGRGAAERARSLWRGQRGLPPRTAGYRRPSKRGALPAPIHRRPETRCGQPGRGLWVAAPAAGPSEVNCVVSVRRPPRPAACSSHSPGSRLSPHGEPAPQAPHRLLLPANSPGSFWGSLGAWEDPLFSHISCHFVHRRPVLGQASPGPEVGVRGRHHGRPSSKPSGWAGMAASRPCGDRLLFRRSFPHLPPPQGFCSSAVLQFSSFAAGTEGASECKQSAGFFFWLRQGEGKCDEIPSQALSLSSASWRAAWNQM